MAALILDASVLIGLLDTADGHHRAAVRDVELADAGDRALLVPASSYGEALVAFAAAGRVPEARAAIAGMGITVLALTEAEAELAAELRARHRALRLPDALVLAAARHRSAELLTYDERLARLARGDPSPGVSSVSRGLAAPGPGAVRTLGEIALRVNDLAMMRDFYERIVGLELMREFPAIAFFRLGEGYGGHTTILALFDRDEQVDTERTTLDHLALTIDVADYATERERLREAGQTVREVVFDWVGWRSLFLTDPEGNRVELVCRDPALIPV